MIGPKFSLLSSTSCFYELAGGPQTLECGIRSNFTGLVSRKCNLSAGFWSVYRFARSILGGLAQKTTSMRCSTGFLILSGLQYWPHVHLAYFMILV